MRLSFLILTAIFFTPSGGFAQTTWQLVWNDEFDGPSDSIPDATKWTYDLGAGGWGNQELEDYTNLPENAHLDGEGNLVIHLESTPAGYTSARLKTQGLFAVQYGRIEARIKLPTGKGVWPAFWMLGANFPNVGWPQCGEIDIMENIGSELSVIRGSLHGPGYSGGSAATNTFGLPAGQTFPDAFHTFAIQWSSKEVTFFVDGTSYLIVTPMSIPPGRQWVFDSPFFLLLNVAVGGTYPGPLDQTTIFPQDMLVDYVRVYQATNSPAPLVSDGGVVDAASFEATLTPGGVASVFGTGLVQGSSADLLDPKTGAFRTSLNGTSVFVNGVRAPLLYLSSGQINFQIPWETLTATRLNIEVGSGNILSNPAPVTLTPSAPSFFGRSETPLMTCTGDSAEVERVCTLWGNGFGPTIPAQQDGVPSPTQPPAMTATECTLTVGGSIAIVNYCGAAPGLIIYQLNFVYPSAQLLNGSAVNAEITVNGSTASFILHPPNAESLQVPNHSTRRNRMAATD